MAAVGTGEVSPNRKPHRLCTFLKYLALAIVVGAVIGVVLAFVHRSHTKKVDIAVGVQTASLTRFSLDRNNSLDYALALNLTWSNNDWVGVYYYELQAIAFYGGQAFSNTQLSKFSQPKQNASIVPAKFRGQTQMAGGWVNEKFSREKGEGYYYIDVEIDVKMWTEKFDNRKAVMEAEVFFAKVDCSLNVPLASNASAANGFERTECKVKF